jgi:hypothetical protein
MAETIRRLTPAAYEQVVQFGRPVGPQDVSGLFKYDAGPEVADVEQAAGVDDHPLKAGESGATGGRSSLSCLTLPPGAATPL